MLNANARVSSQAFIVVNQNSLGRQAFYSHLVKLRLKIKYSSFKGVILFIKHRLSLNFPCFVLRNEHASASDMGVEVNSGK